MTSASIARLRPTSTSASRRDGGDESDARRRARTARERARGRGRRRRERSRDADGGTRDAGRADKRETTRRRRRRRARSGCRTRTRRAGSGAAETIGGVMSSSADDGDGAPSEIWGGQRNASEAKTPRRRARTKAERDASAESYEWSAWASSCGIISIAITATYFRIYARGGRERRGVPGG